ncbi:chloride channel protein C-like [Dendronephthya gigantea]|uniref:chloride channel protein C-like n=1 Tax=Dendronephthya gigantea TaxID=151771 RepID=UPI00106BE055|nr:chloride channel protein C-like [Dendronephthya gigantea]
MSATATTDTSDENSENISRRRGFGVRSGYADEDSRPPVAQTSFFQKGREFESAYDNHKFTEKEKQQLATYDSLDYFPPHSVVYKNWIKRQPARLDWDRWVMMGLIGFTVGFVGFLLHQLIDLIMDFKWEMANEMIKEKEYGLAWFWVVGYSVIFAVLGSSMVVFFRPAAAGSGIPELIGFLNGTIIRRIFNVKTMVVKFFSCVCAVASGLPVGPEGPMIHLGGLIGAGLSQFRSSTLKLNLPYFQRFRNPEDRRNFISAGAGAGVASAFGAPVGGLLFAMEEVSSFWNMKLSWQIFFCTMVATFTTDLFNSAFKGFKYEDDFGLFKAERYILFQIDHGVALHILVFIPVAVLGFLGGILGAVFTFINLKINRFRRYHLARIKRKWLNNCVRVFEVFLLMVIVGTVAVFLPAPFPCSKFECSFEGSKFDDECLVEHRSPLHTERTVNNYTCEEGITVMMNGTKYTNGSFNQVATLLFASGEEAIHHLFSRDTHREFTYGPLLTVLVVYFILACWAAGTSISSGLVVPMLFIGGTYGRVIGKLMVDLFGVHTEGQWAWMDPGAFALIGAASFFGGVSRLTMSLTVIMIEITNDIQFLLPIMVAIMVSKWVGDFVTHPLYHALLEFKCIPFLDSEPVVFTHGGKKNVNLELYQAKDVMSSPAEVLHLSVSVQQLARVLLETPHGGFPIVKKLRHGDEVFIGLVTRLDISILLSHKKFSSSGPHSSPDGAQNYEITDVDYEKLSVTYLPNADDLNNKLHKYVDQELYANIFVDLSPYVNDSALSVQSNFSLHRTYIIYRTLGLRHLTVVDRCNGVVGMITRKDLMGFNLEEKIGQIIEKQQEHTHIEMSGPV